MIIDLHDIGGRWRGHSYKKLLFYHEEYDFDINYHKGGIKGFRMEFKMDKQYINGRQMPFPSVQGVSIAFDQSKIDIDMQSINILLKGANLALKVMKGAIFNFIEPIINHSPMITSTCNGFLSYAFSQTGGRIPMGPI